MINRRQRFRIEAVKPPKQDAQARVHNFNEVSQAYTPEQAIEQAQRCHYAEELAEAHVVAGAAAVEEAR